MAQVFRDCCLKTYRQTGPQECLRCGPSRLRLVRNGDREQLDRVLRWRAKFIRLIGWGLILAAVSCTKISCLKLTKSWMVFTRPYRRHLEPVKGQHVKILVHLTYGQEHPPRCTCFSRCQANRKAILFHSSPATRQVLRDAVLDSLTGLGTAGCASITAPSLRRRTVSCPACPGAA
jgi:hypothetical protein